MERCALCRHFAPAQLHHDVQINALSTGRLSSKAGLQDLLIVVSGLHHIFAVKMLKDGIISDCPNRQARPLPYQGLVGE